MKKKVYIKIVCAALLLIFGLILIFNFCFKGNNLNKKGSTGNYNIDLIKATKENKNYLISPYSIEIALNMLKEGANGNTLKEIDKVLPDRKINNVYVKNRINVANALFIKDSYKNKVKKSYKDVLVNNYNSEVIYDKFKTPDVINNWVNDKTNGMIDKILDDISPEMVIGLANAIAIDVDWSSEFECSLTKSEKFTMENGKAINVEMMHNSYTAGSKYLKSKDATGIIIPYKSYNSKTGKIDYDKGTNLEFIGILPKGDVSSYIDNLTDKKLNDLIKNAKQSSSKYEINLSLPRFKYEYEIPDFIKTLSSLGIKDAFDEDNANFTNIVNRKAMYNNLYVGTAIHKTYIDLNEKGTKAAAVTFFGMKDYAALNDEKEVVNIKFNKPFIYLIRDAETKEMLFFGAVFEPNKWNGTTCRNEK